MTIELHFLPAHEGDAVWVRWGDGNALEHQMLVDMGQKGTGTELRRRLEQLPPHERKFELLIVTHVDADHISGVLTGLTALDPLEELSFGDIWFNGWAHLHGEAVPSPRGGDLEPMGPVQGEILTSWLTTPWNEAFGRGPVVRPTFDPVVNGGALTGPRSITLAGGLVVTVLGPTRERLEGLQATWSDDVQEALSEGKLDHAAPGLEQLGREKPVEPELNSWEDLELLADTPSQADAAEANGSSICVMLQLGDQRVLLTGDAWAPDVIDGLQHWVESQKLAGSEEPTTASGRVPFDVVKLPHHGSEANLSDELIDAIECTRWVVSTSGAKFYHPDAAAMARLIRQRRSPRPHLIFNVPSEFNEWWTAGPWPQTFDYTTDTGSKSEGIVVRID